MMTLIIVDGSAIGMTSQPALQLALKNSEPKKTISNDHDFSVQNEDDFWHLEKAD